MKHFWHGFHSEKGASVQFKKHVIVLYWDPDNSESAPMKSAVGKLSLKYPSVKVKLINVRKDPTRATRQNIADVPAVVLLKDGREVDRLSGDSGGLVLEQLFRKAHV